MNQKKLSLFGFFALTASMVLTVYEYPTFATSKLHLVFFLLLGGLLWFLPVALCAAEMATVEGWKNGGIFSWVSQTLGERFGFAAIFFQWFQITVGFVTMIYFILGALSYVLNFQALNTDPLIKFIGLLIIFWGLTFSQLGGTQRTAKLVKAGFVVGIVIPSIILFGLATAYFIGGNPIEIPINKHAFVPDFSQVSTLVVFVSFILAYMGVEASASHINELENPKRNYPLAMILLVILAISLDAIGGFSVAAVIPQKDLSLSAGVIQTFQTLILHFNHHLGWLVKVIALMIAFGVMGEVSSWVVGPSRGMFAAAQRGLLPKFLRKTNTHEFPVPLVMIQGIIVTLWGAVLTFGGGGNNLSFLVAISLTVVIYLVGYLLFFIGYFVLIYKKQNLKRTYNVPGKRVGKTIIAGIGFLLSIFALFISFVPPASIAKNETHTYQMILLISFVVTAILPFIVYELHDKRGHDTIEEPRHFKARDVNPAIYPAARGEHHIIKKEEHILKH
ncbi:glutamate:gamma-aminobutyrate antiporter [Lactococcus lactis]|uniref:glutamate:gamma-aminobutyrate antiporter n=1 Tax=Lactococcus lactis TaxID=1358 RepID=UPI0014562593|nr:glutamate:gamma-aminobutyrate antiporter [Lactococcus lactis]MCT0438394.1 glutamate:gamma-aminobutyrate antiporter [Lactococcus lactis subsp. lactis]MCT2919207.1 glutamate:gamma-aminobutyrate antiporter [Lactococcus lactis]NLS46509.1 glutamate:gamma-aminobutyrate antiporter [Lactococcus lactis]